MNTKILSLLAVLLCMTATVEARVPTAEEVFGWDFNTPSICVPIVSNGTISVTIGEFGTHGGNRVCDDSGCEGTLVFFYDTSENIMGFSPIMGMELKNTTIHCTISGRLKKFLILIMPLLTIILSS